MSDTAVAINIVVLLGLIIFSMQRLGGHGNQNSSKTIEPSQPPISKEELNLRGLPYDKECACMIDERDCDGKKEPIPFEEMLQHLDRNKTNKKTKENLQ